VERLYGEIKPLELVLLYMVQAGIVSIRWLPSYLYRNNNCDSAGLRFKITEVPPFRREAEHTLLVPQTSPKS
jgi:hypothetical protein